MTLLKWKKVLLMWVKGSLYMKNNPDNLEDTDFEGFLRFCVTHVTLSASTDCEPMIQCLTEFYPNFTPKLDEMGHVIRDDYVYVYTILLHFSCVLKPCEYFLNNINNLSSDIQSSINQFLYLTANGIQETRSRLGNLIANMINTESPFPRIYSTVPVVDRDSVRKSGDFPEKSGDIQRTANNSPMKSPDFYDWNILPQKKPDENVKKTETLNKSEGNLSAVSKIVDCSSIEWKVEFYVSRKPKDAGITGVASSPSAQYDILDTLAKKESLSAKDKSLSPNEISMDSKDENRHLCKQSKGLETENYVLFVKNLLKVMEKYDIALPTIDNIETSLPLVLEQIDVQLGRFFQKYTREQRMNSMLQQDYDFIKEERDQLVEQQLGHPLAHSSSIKENSDEEDQEIDLKALAEKQLLEDLNLINDKVVETMRSMRVIDDDLQDLANQLLDQYERIAATDSLEVKEQFEMQMYEFVADCDDQQKLMTKLMEKLIEKGPNECKVFVQPKSNQIDVETRQQCIDLQTQLEISQKELMTSQEKLYQVEQKLSKKIHECKKLKHKALKQQLETFQFIDESVNSQVNLDSSEKMLHVQKQLEKAQLELSISQQHLYQLHNKLLEELDECEEIEFRNLEHHFETESSIQMNVVESKSHRFIVEINKLNSELVRLSAGLMEQMISLDLTSKSLAKIQSQLLLQQNTIHVLKNQINAQDHLIEHHLVDMKLKINILDSRQDLMQYRLNKQLQKLPVQDNEETQEHDPKLEELELQLITYRNELSRVRSQRDRLERKREKMLKRFDTSQKPLRINVEIQTVLSMTANQANRTQ
ncbi:girdin homolog [Drosophila innubila]|uniref:girdin homolog n=1 Tax=Drosophila innubila TaxID=198719 RepID=UPI00148DCC6A|nr:girdin homolog [Drosophila innubila]